MDVVQSAFGLVAMVGLAWVLGGLPRGVPWRAVVAGLGLQVVIAVILLHAPPVQSLFLAFNQAIDAMMTATRAGTTLVFGYLGGGPPPFKPDSPANGFILAFQALPLVLLYGALAGVLYHYGVIQLLVRGFAFVLRRSLNVGGPAGVSTAANVFVGMVEAPLFVRPYLERLANADLFLVMTAGMATIAGNMMVLYATFLDGLVPNPAGQLLTASLISAPAAVVVAHAMMPGGTGAHDDTPIEAPPSEATNGFEALVTGGLNGVQLLINIVAMLIIMVALVALANGILAAVLPEVAGAPLTLQRLLGWVMIPLAWLMGLPWAEAQAAGTLLGTKVVLNELVAYLEFTAPGAAAPFSERSRVILTYALCSFANFGSLGIMIGGLVAMAPARRKDIVRLAPRTLVSGTMATLMTGCVAGMVIW